MEFVYKDSWPRNVEHVVFRRLWVGDNIRQHYLSLPRLSYSIARHGLQEPPKVISLARPGHLGQDLCVIDGQRRVRALDLLGMAPGQKMQVMVMIDMSVAQAEEHVRIIHTNHHSRDVMLYDKAMDVRRAVEYGMSLFEIAYVLDQSEREVGVWLKALEALEKYDYKPKMMSMFVRGLSPEGGDAYVIHRCLVNGKEKGGNRLGITKCDQAPLLVPIARAFKDKPYNLQSDIYKAHKEALAIINKQMEKQLASMQRPVHHRHIRPHPQRDVVVARRDASHE